MKRTVLLIFIFCGLLMADITPEEMSKIKNAIPQSAYAKPQAERTILIFSFNLVKGKPRYGHESIEYAKEAFRRMGEETGAFNCVFSDDTLMFRRDSLKRFDTVVFNNTAGVIFTDPQLRINLLDYVARGGGFVGLHAAAATFVQWPEYWQFPAFGQMLGAYEDGGHPWGPEETIYLEVEENDHPLTRMFDPKLFPIQDEVFQFRRPYSRDNLRVLLTINTDKTDMNPDRRFLAERYKDKDFAMSWIREYGKGRVFYTSLGHNKHLFWNEQLLKHFLAGIQYAVGDLKADATPSNEISAK